MGTQVTITLEDKVNEKLQKIQEDFTREYNESLSFSEVLNEILQKGLL
jgi:predicted CopG family antitoxin